MREREIDRVQRVKDAQKRLEEIEHRMRDEAVLTRKDGELTVSVPLLVREKRALEVFLERNQKWATTPRKKKAPKSLSAKAETASPLAISQEQSVGQSENHPPARSRMAAKKSSRKSKKPSIDLSKPVGNVIDPAQMTDEEKRSELGEILATGILRLQTSKTPRQLEHDKRVTYARKHPEQPRDLLTEDMLAERWMCSASRLQRWRVDGVGIPYLKIGGRVLYRLVDIQAYEESCLVHPKPTGKGRGHDV